MKSKLRLLHRQFFACVFSNTIQNLRDEPAKIGGYVYFMTNPAMPGHTKIGLTRLQTLAFGHHEDRTPTHGYAQTREPAITASRQTGGKSYLALSRNA
jgi:hypothetical protein